jgi:hypothetical protein
VVPRDYCCLNGGGGPAQLETEMSFIADTLYDADNNTYSAIVIDTDGGIWWPNADAESEIDASDDPEAKAIEICTTTPMRGEWMS